MSRLNVCNVTLMALTLSCFLQLGGQLFALSVVAGTIAEAPPRSLAILEGKYGYDSSAFWETLPPITATLFVIALIANWKTSRRTLVTTAFALFIAGGLLAGFVIEPQFATIVEGGYRDAVDPQLQRRAQNWYAMDWAMWSIVLMGGIALLFALVTPVSPRREPTPPNRKIPE